MDAYGNPIPGPSKEFVNIETTESNSAYDFEWLEKEFKDDDDKEDVKVPTSIIHSLNKNDSYKLDRSIKKN